MTRVALIGGTGSASLIPATGVQRKSVITPFGESSVAILSWFAENSEVLFISRHGPAAGIPPHRVNYRANLSALASLKPDIVIGVNAVGGIVPAASPGRLVVPDQLIDYTWGREHTYFDGSAGRPGHIEFDPPFSGTVRASLLAAGREPDLAMLDRGTYGVTQGPRLETAAEIERLARDGCDIVGMTAMPEAALARELDLPYGILAIVVNRAAGRLPAGQTIHEDMGLFMKQGMDRGRLLLGRLFSLL